jgi:hypothetical protein
VRSSAPRAARRSSVVVEAERTVAGDGDHGAARGRRHGRADVGGTRGVERRRAAGEAPEGVEVDGRGEASGQSVEIHLVFFGRGEAEVAFGDGERGVAREPTNDWNAGDPFDGGAADLGVGGAGDAIQDDGADPGVGISGVKAVHDGGGRLGHRVGIDDEDDRRAEERGAVGGRATGVRAGASIEETHHAFDDGDVGLSLAGGAAVEDAEEGIFVEEPAVERAARAAGGASVVRGVDVIGAELEGRDAEAALEEAAHDTDGDGRFS